jgi:aryl-alcohol dehydrogenase-like predicted oxidoreductase
MCTAPQARRPTTSGRLVEELRSLAAERDCTPGQVALAWLLAQPTDLVPIPGTKKVKYLKENAGARNVDLGPEDVAKLTEVFDPAAVQGARYGRIG